MGSRTRKRKLDLSEHQTSSSSDSDSDVDIESAQRCAQWIPEVNASNNERVVQQPYNAVQHKVARSRTDHLKMLYVFRRNRFLYQSKLKGKNLESVNNSESGSSDSDQDSDFETPNEDSDNDGVHCVPVNSFVKSSRIIDQHGTIRNIHSNFDRSNRSAEPDSDTSNSSFEEA